jgi:hypothetical protein
MFPASVAMSPRTRKEGRQCTGATRWRPAGDNQHAYPGRGYRRSLLSGRVRSILHQA